MFEVPASLVGGHANCPGCERATAVEGLRDPMWRLVQVAAALVIVLVTALTVNHFGVAAGCVVGACGAAAFWLLSRCL